MQNLDSMPNNFSHVPYCTNDYHCPQYLLWNESMNKNTLSTEKKKEICWKAEVDRSSKYKDNWSTVMDRQSTKEGSYTPQVLWHTIYKKWFPTLYVTEQCYWELMYNFSFQQHSECYKLGHGIEVIITLNVKWQQTK